MPVIRITDQTWERLKRWAVPLEDSPEDALRKALDAAEERLTFRPDHTSHATKTTSKRSTSESKLRRGMKNPEEAYRRPILETLEELGGRGPSKDVLDVVGEKMRGRLTEVDYEKLPSGADIRWRNTAAWSRLILVKDGLLKNDSPHGIWEISSQGKQQLLAGSTDSAKR